MAVPVLRAICGPTAAGKSALALALAEREGAAIVSADSRQLYRGFDLGTAKPTAGERARVPHYGVDVAEPTERWSAARWADACDGWLADAAALGRAPLLVGGTGLYLRALASPLFDEPELEPARREALAAWLEERPVEELRRWVAALDPGRAHLQRTQLLRALEVGLLTGRPISAWHSAAARPPRVRLRYLVVDPGPPLAERIERRTDAMLAAGWVDEVRRLVGEVPADATAWKASGYDALRRHVAGELTLDEARRLIVIETRQYAKRQRTWFRHQLPAGDVLRVDPAAPDATSVVEAWWRGAAHPHEELA
ncbi:tRNA (adenosine(37)-N6)-dimethylallyltransferase MiaA [Roseisolibacter sp. H3M3-2]|uniref:tRNA (adenosine(37)-N6)-dimethylallyltransferase MiaA n=1 Tax=Roseisolibacter sp. H3M3-2 TaxID=3031323 RepID=UPI0023DB508F|nr:tRNA (adenosine(37)-N6)-dimethylallyltransferase MiaA [Roseisolibacter sp. H3M3-2]MDF1504947.1 tRNA (adenosine(37)-N6)-dimethylallyltransferase MiaA [Roseisolibacter sp. H3M3-2]